MVVPTWEELCAEAERHVGTDCELESIFTEEELRCNEFAICQLNKEFSIVQEVDVCKCLVLMLQNYVRDYFDKKFPEEEMQKLANSKVSKVPYPA